MDNIKRHIDELKTRKWQTPEEVDGYFRITLSAVEDEAYARGFGQGYKEGKADGAEEAVDTYQTEYEQKHIASAVEVARAEERKAFGGCTNCYGKGYHTTIDHQRGRGESDFGTGDVVVSYTPSIYRPCSCDRGVQFKKVMELARQEVFNEK